MDLTITVSSQRDEDLVEVAGSVDHATVPYVRQVLFELFDAGRCQVVIDVSRLLQQTLDLLRRRLTE
ncbi:hypothetical protein [Dactylosporangium sp. NPDC000521]|uniref:hypothetical protein n=1 Tax=Dactylosporangium sp. NPDC000521 TaxID=3363975 RepID=UPI0036A4D274